MGECKAALLYSQQGLKRQLSRKDKHNIEDKHNIVTKRLWKTPGWFTCMPFQTWLLKNILGNITKCFNYPSLLVEIKWIFLSTWFFSHTCTKVEQIPTRKQNTNDNSLQINSLLTWQPAEITVKTPQNLLKPQVLPNEPLWCLEEK